MATLCLLRASSKGINVQRLFYPQAVLSGKLSPLISAGSQQKSITLSPKVQSNDKVKSHTSHWAAERVAAVTLIGLMPAAYFYHPASMDYILVTGIMLHAHWSLEGVAGDYIHGYPSETGERRYPWTKPIVKYGLYLLSASALFGLYHFNYNDVGIIKAIRMLWDA